MGRVGSRSLGSNGIYDPWVLPGGGRVHELFSALAVDLGVPSCSLRDAGEWFRFIGAYKYIYIYIYIYIYTYVHLSMDYVR